MRRRDPSQNFFEKKFIAFFDVSEHSESIQHIKTRFFFKFWTQPNFRFWVKFEVENSAESKKIDFLCARSTQNGLKRVLKQKIRARRRTAVWSGVVRCYAAFGASKVEFSNFCCFPQKMRRGTLLKKISNKFLSYFSTFQNILNRSSA